MGANEDEWENLAALATDAGADMLELELLLPPDDFSRDGQRRGFKSRTLQEILCQAVRRGSKLPFMAKMTPNITDMVPVAQGLLGRRGGWHRRHQHREIDLLA
jgi:dihydropyrimidine dehydrogenase (NAD+) subunit PreA